MEIWKVLNCGKEEVGIYIPGINTKVSIEAEIQTCDCGHLETVEAEKVGLPREMACQVEIEGSKLEAIATEEVETTKIVPQNPFVAAYNRAMEPALA